LSLNLFIRDVEGERRIEAERLPLRVGTGSDCDLRLPGPGGGPVMMLDVLDDAPFVQPVGRDASMAINGEPLTASRRLQDGDELRYFGSRILVQLEPARLTLEVRLEDSAYVTKPPELGDAGEQPAEETIAPTAFQRAAETPQATADKAGQGNLRWIIGAAMVLLIIVSFLLFTSKSVKFEVTPGEPDSFSVSGGWFRMPLGDRVLLRKGSYTVQVSQQGYFDVTQNFEVGDEQNIIIDIEMRKLPGHVTVVTNPPTDAVVAINESEVGPAPFGPVELLPGEHSVSVRAERFLPYNGVINIPGLGRHEQLSVQLVPRWASVEINSNPPGARIFAGEEQVGETPATIELMEGSHQISVVRDGFSAWDGTVVAEPNTEQALPLIRLQPANAKLLVSSIPRGANVTVNGRYRGQSPITLDLAPEVNYEIGLSKAGYGMTSRKVRLQAAASDSITVDLTANRQCAARRRNGLRGRAGARYGQFDAAAEFGTAPHRSAQAGLRIVVTNRYAQAGLSADLVGAPALARRNRARVGRTRAQDGGRPVNAPGRARHLYHGVIAQRAGTAGKRGHCPGQADETVPDRREGSDQPGIRAVPRESRFGRRYSSVDGRRQQPGGQPTTRWPASPGQTPRSTATGSALAKA
jgi:hypothetical protein